MSFRSKVKDGRWVAPSGQVKESGGGNRNSMEIRERPRPARFMFWCTAPFFFATLALMPFLSRPAGVTGWAVLVAFELVAIFALFGLYDLDRYHWCLRIVGGIVFAGYFAYLISMIASGNWAGDGRRSSTTAINALIGMIVFGYPGFMYAFFGRFTYRR